MTTTEIKFNRTTAESLAIYAPALIDAIKGAKIDAHPLRVMEDTYEFSKLTAGQQKKLKTVEWIIGWFHGISEAHGVTLEVVWAEASRLVELEQTKPARKRRKAA